VKVYKYGIQNPASKIKKSFRVALDIVMLDINIQRNKKRSGE
jgi:hypothetical protein